MKQEAHLPKANFPKQKEYESKIHVSHSLAIFLLFQVTSSYISIWLKPLQHTFVPKHVSVRRQLPQPSSPGGDGSLQHDPRLRSGRQERSQLGERLVKQPSPCFQLEDQQHTTFSAPACPIQQEKVSVWGFPTDNFSFILNSSSPRNTKALKVYFV